METEENWRATYYTNPKERQESTQIVTPPRGEQEGKLTSYQALGRCIQGAERKTAHHVQ